MGANYGPDGLPAHMQRVQVEVAALRVNRDALKAFVEHPSFTTRVPTPTERALMTEQLRLQTELIMILDDRLSLYELH